MFENVNKYKSNIPACSTCRLEYDSYYRVPRVLPKCGHTFCEKCIHLSVQPRANRKVFICPECQSETIIRKGVTQDVPKNSGILEIVKNLKKLQFQETSPMSYRSASKESPSKSKVFCKQHPTKQLDLVCQTCNYDKVCSICALTANTHFGHKFVEYVPASKFDLKEVKQVFIIIEDTVKQTILPEASQNIIKQTQQSLIKQLISSVKDYFRQNYYKVIQKKQNQVISQVKEIRLQGGISKKIQQIAKSYDLLKIQYLQIFRKAIHKQNTSLQTAEDFIQKCKDLHNEIQLFSSHAQNQSKNLFKNISTKIHQSTYFRLTEVPFSLKQLFTDKIQVSSPAKYKVSSFNEIQKKKSVDASLKSSGSIERSKSKNLEEFKSVQNTSFDGERKPLTSNALNAKKSNFLPPKHKINKSEAKIDKKSSDIISIININSKAEDKKNSVSQAKSSCGTDRMNRSSFDNIKQLRKSTQKQKNSTTKLNISQIAKVENSQQQPAIGQTKELKIKEVRPSKQVPLNLKSKYSAITKQINRQLENQSLQLISMEINDSLIVYVCDYLKTKRIKFSMIKLVKNNLTDEGLSILLGYLFNDDRTQVLNLTSNQLTSKSLDLFIEFGSKNNFLKTIYLSHNKVTITSVKQKAKQLQNLGLEIII